MTRPAARAILTPRDLSLLEALSLCPFTTAQLHSLSWTFTTPFPSEHRLRQRLRQLSACGLVRSCPYATTGPGRLCYHLLTRQGFRLLYGPSAALPPRNVFRPVSRALEAHTQLLSAVVCQLLIFAHEEGVRVDHFTRENGLRLEANGEVFLPDAAFHLRTPSGRTLAFYLEVDNRTEPLCSQSERNTLERKIRQYEAWADRSPGRFRVLFVTRGNPGRVGRFLALAYELSGNPDRSLFYATTTAEFFQARSFRTPVFRNHRNAPVQILDERALRPPTQPAQKQVDWLTATAPVA